MKNTSYWKVNARKELILAEKARETGNEGKARVCARRAAGYIIGEYLHRQGHQISNRSAYYRLQYLQSLAEVSPEVRQLAHDFLLRITPEGQLPVDTDLLAGVHWLAMRLLGERL